MTVRAVLALALAVVASVSPARAQVAMPDPAQMAGRAIPSPELSDGTVSVRLVRQELGNNIVGHEVTVTAGDVTGRAKTDGTGRAAFTGLPAGVSATAEAIVDGERLVSIPFAVPQTGGLRVILIAGLSELTERRRQEADAALKAPPTKGIVVFGGESRVIFEFQDDTLRGFYLLDIVNTARSRVDTGGPLIVELPRGLVGATILQGSYQGATVNGNTVIIQGPFPPGTSSVQIGFRVLYTGSEASITQTFPAALERLSVVAEKVGDIHMTSPQFTQHGDVRAADGTPFILGTGGSLAPGSELRLQFSGLPNHSTWPRNVALGLALAIVAAGGWLACAGRSGDDSRKLAARRDSLFGELVQLEGQRRAGRVDETRYALRRQQLMAELERVYGELDTAPEAGRAA